MIPGSLVSRQISSPCCLTTAVDMRRLLLSVLAFAACSGLLGAASEAAPPTPPLFSEHVSTTALGDEIYVSSYRLDLRPLQPGGAIFLRRVSGVHLHFLRRQRSSSW